MLKLVVFCLNQASSPSQIPDAFKKNPGCSIHNFWTETRTPIIKEEFDQESGNHLLSLNVGKVIGSCFGKWHFPRGAGVALTAGLGSAAMEGARGGPRLLKLSFAFCGDPEGPDLGPETCGLTWEGSVGLPPPCPCGRAGENHPSCTAKALWG